MLIHFSRAIRTNQHAFGRWGYGRAYHLGDLSHALFPDRTPPAPKYQRWVRTLFRTTDPPCLRHPLFVSIMSWERGKHEPSGLATTVPGIEKELIALASALPESHLMNVDGR